MNSLGYECPVEKLNHWVVLFIFWITGKSWSPYISGVISNSVVKINQAPFSISKSIPAISCQLEGVLEPVEQLVCELTNILKQASMLPFSHCLILTISMHTLTICWVHTEHKGDKEKTKQSVLKVKCWASMSHQNILSLMVSLVCDLVNQYQDVYIDRDFIALLLFALDKGVCQKPWI